MRHLSLFLALILSAGCLHAQPPVNGQITFSQVANASATPPIFQDVSIVPTGAFAFWAYNSSNSPIVVGIGANLTISGSGPYFLNATGGAGSTSWGLIGGTLSNQLDLASALGLLVPKTTTVNSQPLSSNVSITTISGNAGTATALQNAQNINGVSFNGTAGITVAAAAGTLTGGTLASGVTASSLASAAGGVFGTNAYTSTPIMPANNSVSLTYTGTPIAPINIQISPADIVVPASSAAGAHTYTQTASPAFYASVGYSELGNTPPISYLTALTFNDLVIGGRFAFENCYGLTTLSWPLITSAASFYIVADPNLTTFSLPDLVRVGNNAILPFNGDFAVEVCNSITSVSLPNLVSVTGQQDTNGGFALTQLPALTTISVPSLTTLAMCSLQLNTLPLVTTISFPVLTLIGGDFFQIESMASVTTWNFPDLVIVGGEMDVEGLTSLTSLSCNALQTAAGLGANPSVRLGGMTALTTVSFSGMVNYGSSIVMSNLNGNLTSVTLGTIGTLKNITGPTIDISGQQLTTVNVNAILHLLVSLDGTGGTTLFGSGQTVLLNGGTNGAPSGAGVTDKATLIGRGATVTTN